MFANITLSKLRILLCLHRIQACMHHVHKGMRNAITFLIEINYFTNHD